MGKSKCRCLCQSLIYLFTLFIVLCLITFVILPVVFKYSVGVQRAIIFPIWATSNDNLSDVESFGLQGVRNFYLTVNSSDGNITLGAWQILPTQVLTKDLKNDHYNYEDILSDGEFDILLYLHGNGGVRSSSLELYKILRNYFHVIAVDYRGYGDSTQAELKEDYIVNDMVEFYKWIRVKSKARIFFWGHSLGTGISTHTISNLRREEEIPSGLILETPFSTVPDVIEEYLVVKVLSWFPWEKATMIDPIIENGMGFESTKYILNVDCPIMILHAKDDTIIPYSLANKLYETALQNRDFDEQGNVTFHLFEAKGYDHMQIFLAPELPMYISQFIEDCNDFENKKNTTLYQS